MWFLIWVVMQCLQWWRLDMLWLLIFDSWPSQVTGSGCKWKVQCTANREHLIHSSMSTRPECWGKYGHAWSSRDSCTHTCLILTECVLCLWYHSAWIFKSFYVLKEYQKLYTCISFCLISASYTFQAFEKIKYHACIPPWMSLIWIVVSFVYTHLPSVNIPILFYPSSCSPAAKVEADWDTSNRKRSMLPSPLQTAA